MGITEPQGFMLEAALEAGFRMTNDDGDEYACTQEQVLKFALMLLAPGDRREENLLRALDRAQETITRMSEQLWRAADRLSHPPIVLDVLSQERLDAARADAVAFSDAQYRHVFGPFYYRRG
jgi:hypothetical protein